MAENQHYVPEVYLKHFTKGNYFYSATPKRKYFSKPKLKHTRQVCYLEDFYDNLDSENEAERKYIERNAFKYENSDLVRVFNKLNNNSSFLFSTDHKKLIEIYLSLKHRNTFIRNFYKSFDLEPSINKALGELLNRKDIIDALEGKPFEEIANNVKSSIINDKNLPENLHKSSIIEMAHNSNPTINEAYTAISRLKVFVFEPINTIDYFITSDNPGFTIVDTKKVYNLNLGKFDGIGFPLSSRKFLFFCSQEKAHPLDIKRTIYYFKIPQENVKVFNDCTTFTCNQNIFCENLNYLDDYTKDFRVRHKIN